MNYFMSVSTVQSILIELGVLLQVVAIIAVIKQRSSYRMLPPHNQQMKHYDLDEMAPGKRDADDPAHEYGAPQGRKGKSFLKGCELTETSKPHFKQEFKFRQCR